MIFREREFADKFFLILSGKVGLETQRNGASIIVIQILGPGEALGWSWLFPPFHWHFTARALEPCTVLAFRGSALLVRAEEDPVFGYELMKRISRQVIRRLQATRERFIHKLSLRERKPAGKPPTMRKAVSYRNGACGGTLPKPAARRQPRRANEIVEMYRN